MQSAIWAFGLYYGKFLKRPKYATFEGGFFNFLRAKKKSFLKNILATALKSYIK
jgi:hypothetical protein